MFYLTTQSTHFIYGYMASDIWLRTILIERKETRCRHIGYSFRLTPRLFYMHHPTDRIAHTTAFVTPVVEHWLIRKEDHSPSILPAQHTQSMLVRMKYLMPPNGNMYELINHVCQSWIEHRVFVPHCWIYIYFFFNLL